MSYNKDFIEKYPEIAAIFYKHIRNGGDYIPDYRYEDLAEDLTKFFNSDIKLTVQKPLTEQTTQPPMQYTPNLENILEVKEIKIANTRIKVVADLTIPRNEIWFTDTDGHIQKFKMI